MPKKKRLFSVDPGAAQAERRELVKKLERGFQQVQESDEYRSYLDTVTRSTSTASRTRC